MFIITVFFIYIMALISRQAEQIADDVLSASDEILAISLMDISGNIIAAGVL